MNDLIAAAGHSAGSGVDLGKPILNSARFSYQNSNAGGYCGHLRPVTPKDGSNKFTFSTWFRTTKGFNRDDVYNNSTNVVQYVLLGADNTGYGSFEKSFCIYLSTTGRLVVRISSPTSSNTVVSTRYFFTDMTAWHHVVVAVDYTQASLSNAVTMYINGVLRQTYISDITNPTETAGVYGSGTSYWNTSTNPLIIGAAYTYDTTFGTGPHVPFEGYMADTYLIDGQVLQASDFVKFADNSRIVPKEYIGAYGVTGFHLTYEDANNIGLDSSGLGNNMVDTSVSNSTTYPIIQVSETPYNAHARYLSYFTHLFPQKNASYVYSYSDTPREYVISSLMATSGKYYFETSLYTSAPTTTGAGIVSINGPAYSLSPIREAIVNSGDSGVLNKANLGVLYIPSSGDIYASDASNASGFNVQITVTPIGGATLGVAVDIDAGKIWFSMDGTWLTGDPVVGTNPTATFSNIDAYGNVYPVGPFALLEAPTNATFAAASTLRTMSEELNYTPPNGFELYNTKGLPEPKCIDGREYIYSNVYIGNGTGSQSISFPFTPDLIWVKNYSSNTHDHIVFDSTRGDGLPATITGTTVFAPAINNSISFGQNSVSISTPNTYDYVNQSGVYHYMLGIKKHPEFFNIVKYIGTGVSGRLLAHGLQSAPTFAIIKTLNSPTGNNYTYVYHKSIGFTSETYMDIAHSGLGSATNVECISAADSTNLTLGLSQSVNENGTEYVAYIFSNYDSLFTTGYYMGTGNNISLFNEDDYQYRGPTIYTGFKPSLIFIRDVNAGDWIIMDGISFRSPNPLDTYMTPATRNTSLSESGLIIEFLATGFRIRGNSSKINTNGHHYVYAVFGEQPTKYAQGR